MALYEIRKHNVIPSEGECVHKEHDKDKAIEWANTKTTETGELFDVVEIKHIHITSTASVDDFDFM